MNLIPLVYLENKISLLSFAIRKKILKKEIARDKPSVVISKAPCVLLPEERKRKKDRLTSLMTECNGCGACRKLGCPAIQWTSVTPEQREQLGLKKEKQKGYAVINDMCNGCGQCEPLCKFKAIVKAEGNI